MKIFFYLFFLVLAFECPLFAQDIEKITIEKDESYLAIRPSSEDIKAAIIMFISFGSPESILAETRIPQVAASNGILTVIAPLGDKIYLDSSVAGRIDKIIEDVKKRFSVDPSKFAFGAFDYGGNIILRYSERTFQEPERYKVKPKAVFSADGPVDLSGLYLWCERQISKNYHQGTVSDAKYILGVLQKEIGTLEDNMNRYKELSPFFKDQHERGNEQFLKNTALRVYYDNDINWYIKNRGNGYYDTNIPDATELINRLSLMGNKNAEFVEANRPGMRNDGSRNPNTLSIIDEVDFINWVKQKLDIFDPITWKAPYYFPSPEGWISELFSLPPVFAPEIKLRGVEDIRFMPGWGNAESDEYWSYSFLWWVDRPDLNDESLTKYLRDYYDGLVKQNIEKRKIPENLIVPTVVDIKRRKVGVGNGNVFEGTIKMLDYMAAKPIILHVLIQLKECADENGTAIFFDISPKNLDHPVWKQLLQLQNQFDCKNLRL